MNRRAFLPFFGHLPTKTHQDPPKPTGFPRALGGGFWCGLVARLEILPIQGLLVQIRRSRRRQAGDLHVPQPPSSLAKKLLVRLASACPLATNDWQLTTFSSLHAQRPRVRLDIDRHAETAAPQRDRGRIDQGGAVAGGRVALCAGVWRVPLSRRPATPSLPRDRVGMESVAQLPHLQGFSLAADRSSPRTADTCDLRRLSRQL